MQKLQVIIGSTRPGRVGLPIGQWIYRRAVEHGAFDVELLDLAEINLPMMNEPLHPRLRQYSHDHTKRWSATIESGDAFVIVTPEYNHGLIAPVKNAIDYLVWEWAYKPVGFVSYGGAAAGTRAVAQLMPILSQLKMVPVPETVSIPFVAQFIDEEKRLRPNDVMEAAVKSMLDELQRWAAALRALRP